MSLPPGIDLSKIPVMKPPPGMTSNFINPPSIGNTIIIVTVIFVTLMLGFVVVRIYTRGFLNRSFGLDDYACFLAAIGSVIHAGLVIEQTQHGYGTHTWNIPVSALTPAELRILHAITIVSYPTILFVKSSILLLYLRIFGVDKKFRNIIYALIAIQAFFYLGSTGVAIGLLYACTIEHASTRPFCTQNYRLVIAQSVFGVVTDFLILGIPIVRVWRLQLSNRRKIGVIGIFMTGLIACVAGLTYMSYIVRYIHNPDVYFAAGRASIYGCVERNLGIISGAMLCLPVFYRKSHLKEFSLSTMAALKSRLLSSRLSNRSKSRSRSSKKSFDHGGSPPITSPSVSSGGFDKHDSPQTKKGSGGGGGLNVNGSQNDIVLLPYSSSLSEDQSHNHPSYSNKNNNKSNSNKNNKNSPDGIVKTNEYTVVSEETPSPHFHPEHRYGQGEV